MDFTGNGAVEAGLPAHRPQPPHCPAQDARPLTSTLPAAPKLQKTSSRAKTAASCAAASLPPTALKGGAPLSACRVITQPVGAAATDSRIAAAGSSRQAAKLAGERRRQTHMPAVAAE